MACKGRSIDDTCPELALHQWELYMESSACGPWQELDELQIITFRLQEFGGEEIIEPPSIIQGLLMLTKTRS
jgi:hypothetical protein